MKKIDVLMVWPIQPEQVRQLEQTYRLHRLDLASDKEALLADTGDRIRAVVTTHTGGFPESLLQRLPALDIVACGSVGTDSLCIDACHRRGVVVTNTPDVLTEDVADLGMLLMLATVRRLLPGVDWIRQGHWQKQGMMSLSTSLTGKRLGIVGLGRIGRAVARRAEAFGMQVSYYGRRQQPEQPYPWYSDLVQLAAASDVLLLTVPGTAGTEKLVDARVLDALGPRGYLVNIARGSVVDEEALVDRLARRQLAGAGLDVFAHEPRVPVALLAMDHVVLQPHCGSATVETRGAMAQLVVDNLAAYFSGRPLLTPLPR